MESPVVVLLTVAITADDFLRGIPNGHFPSTPYRNYTLIPSSVVSPTLGNEHNKRALVAPALLMSLALIWWATTFFALVCECHRQLDGDKKIP